MDDGHERLPEPRVHCYVGIFRGSKKTELSKQVVDAFREVRGGDDRDEGANNCAVNCSIEGELEVRRVFVRGVKFHEDATGPGLVDLVLSERVKVPDEKRWREAKGQCVCVPAVGADDGRRWCEDTDQPVRGRRAPGHDDDVAW